MKKIIVAIVLCLLIVSAGIWGYTKYRAATLVPSLDGYVDEELFGNALEKSDMIILDSPRPNDLVESPLTIRGKARGTWFFEASFSIVITNWDGRIIGQGYAQAKDEWMTTEFVPFEGTIEFETPTSGVRGSLILQKDNPSGLPEHDDELEIPVRFGFE